MAHFLYLGRQKLKTQKLASRLNLSTTFEVLGGLGESGWRLSWAILARSWAILGDLGLKLGPSRQDVRTKMAKMSQDRRTWEQNGWLKATRYGKGQCVLMAFERASGGA